MKFFILILLVAACSSQLLGGFQPIDLNVAQKNSDIQDLINYGMQDVVQQTYVSEEYSFSSQSFSLTKINSVQTDGSNYKFNCDFTNEDSTTIQAEFEINYNSFTYEKKVVSSSYKVISHSVEENVEQSYTELDQSEVEYSDEVQSILNYGLESVVQKIKGKTENYKIVKINHVERQIVQAAYFYKCDVNIINIETQKITNATYIVYYEPSMDEKSLIDYSFDDISNSDQIIAPVEQSYIPLDPSFVENDMTIKSCLDYGINEITKIGVKEKKFVKTFFSLSKLVQVWTQILGDGIFYKFDCDLKSVIGISIKTQFTVYYSILTSSFQLTQYTYDVLGVKVGVPGLPGSGGGNGESKPTSGSQVQTKQINVQKSSYVKMTSSEIKYSSEVQSCVDYGVKQIVQSSDYKVTKFNSVYRKVVQNTVYYKFDVDVTSSAGKTTGLSCIVNYNPQIEQKYVQAYSYYTKKVEQSSYSSNTATITNPDGSSIQTSSTSSSYSSQQYTQISNTVISSNSKYKSILQSGINQCAQSLVSQNIVSSSSFSVVKVKKVFSQKRTSQEDCVFSVQLVNQQGISVDVNLNMNYQAKTGQKTLTSYFVEGYSKAQSLTETKNQVTVVNYNKNQISAANYQKISQSKSLQSKAAIAYGAQQVVKQVSKKESLMATDFKITQIQKVYQEVINSSSYTVVATMTNSMNQKIDCSYSVNYLSSKSKSFNSYSYVLY